MNNSTNAPTGITLAEAVTIALAAHEGQTYATGTPLEQPYVQHPLRVMARLREYGEEAMIVGVLHDVVEDCDPMWWALLASKLPPHLMDAVLSVTRDPGESYDDFIARAGQNELGRKVKIADLRENYEFPGGEQHKARYQRALNQLGAL